MIVSSFAQQYGIRLYQEYESISYEEFRQLLVGLNGETALGYVVSIRSETDIKRINNMTKKELEIRQEWSNFLKKQKNNVEQKELSSKEIDDIFSKMFGG